MNSFLTLHFGDTAPPPGAGGLSPCCNSTCSRMCCCVSSSLAPALFPPPRTPYCVEFICYSHITLRFPRHLIYWYTRYYFFKRNNDFGVQNNKTRQFTYLLLRLRYQQERRDSHTFATLFKNGYIIAPQCVTLQPTRVLLKELYTEKT